jgi:hypothetical protein
VENPSYPVLVDIDRPDLLLHTPANDYNLEPEVAQCISKSVNLRRHFRNIGVTDDGQLALLSRKERLIVLSANSNQLVFRDQDRNYAARSAVQKFHTTSAPSGYLLEVATWENGSRAWLDSRGLLHLRSSDASIPELTLVLHEGLVAGWCSNGRTFGNRYFVGPENQDSDVSARIIVDCLAPFLRGLR